MMGQSYMYEFVFVCVCVCGVGECRGMCVRGVRLCKLYIVFACLLALGFLAKSINHPPPHTHTHTLLGTDLRRWSIHH